MRVFISHRHADKPVADVLTKHLTYWGIPEEDVYQSSAAGHGPGKGRALTDELKSALNDARLLLLVYTFERADWSYCMWEAGVATNPLKESTRIVVLQCAKLHAPKVFKDQVHVTLEEESILGLVRQFHQDEGFFPGEAAYAPSLSDEALRKRADDLLEDLRDTIPQGEPEDRYRWDFMVLELPPEAVSSLQELGADQAEETRRLVGKASHVVQDFGKCLKHFGFDSMQDDLSCDALVERWREEMESLGCEAVLDWWSELCREIKRSADNAPAQPSWTVLRSAHYPDWSFYPVLNHVRLLPDDTMRLHVYFYRLSEQQ